MRANKGTHGSLVAPAPVSVFTFTAEKEDRGPVVGVNKWSWKWVKRRPVSGLSGKPPTRDGWKKVYVWIREGRVLTC